MTVTGTNMKLTTVGVVKKSISRIRYLLSIRKTNRC